MALFRSAATLVGLVLMTSLPGLAQSSGGTQPAPLQASPIKPQPNPQVRAQLENLYKICYHLDNKNLTRQQLKQFTDAQFALLPPLCQAVHDQKVTRKEYQQIRPNLAKVQNSINASLNENPNLPEIKAIRSDINGYLNVDSFVSPFGDVPGATY
jgi:hypothetical protein